MVASFAPLALIARHRQENRGQIMAGHSGTSIIR
jgi:hypothetical protein